MKQEPRPAIHVEKQLGWACKLGEVESLGISKVGQTLLARLMESQIWHQLVALLGKSLEKVRWPLLALMSETSVSPSMLLVPFTLLPWCWNSEGV